MKVALCAWKGSQRLLQIFSAFSASLRCILRKESEDIYSALLGLSTSLLDFSVDIWEKKR